MTHSFAPSFLVPTSIIKTFIWTMNEFVVFLHTWTREIQRDSPFLYYYIILCYIKEVCLKFFFCSFWYLLLANLTKKWTMLAYSSYMPMPMINACCLCVSSSLSFTFFYYLLRWICSRISAFVVFRAINTIQRIMNGLIENKQTSDMVECVCVFVFSV